MYRIPETFDGNCLVNEIISHITFGINFITLSINKGFIQFSGSFAFNSKGKMVTQAEVFPVENDYGLLIILEKKIIRAIVNVERNELEIEFEGNNKLLLSSNEFYESFHLKINELEFIV